MGGMSEVGRPELAIYLPLLSPLLSSLPSKAIYLIKSVIIEKERKTNIEIKVPLWLCEGIKPETSDLQSVRCAS